MIQQGSSYILKSSYWQLYIERHRLSHYNSFRTNFLCRYENLDIISFALLQLNVCTPVWSIVKSSAICSNSELGSVGKENILLFSHPFVPQKMTCSADNLTWPSPTCDVVSKTWIHQWGWYKSSIWEPGTAVHHWHSHVEWQLRSFCVLMCTEQSCWFICWMDIPVPFQSWLWPFAEGLYFVPATCICKDKDKRVKIDILPSFRLIIHICFNHLLLSSPPLLQVHNFLSVNVPFQPKKGGRLLL